MKKHSIVYLCITLFVAFAAMMTNVQPVAAQAVEEGTDYTGTVISINADGTFAIQVTDEAGATYTYIVTPPAGFDITTIAVGDTVEFEGEVAEDGLNITIPEGGVIDVETPEVELPEDEAVGYYCGQAVDEHPVGGQLAASYGVPYADLQSWFCQGYGWGEIKLALKTAEILKLKAVEGTTPLDYAAILAARAAGQGWGQIWQDLAIKGKASHTSTEDATTETTTHGNSDHTNNGNGNGNSGNNGNDKTKENNGNGKNK